MNRERVLEDILRTRASKVELDPGALAIILQTPSPTAGHSDGNERNNTEGESNKRELNSSTPPGPGTGTASSVAREGRSLAQRLLRFIGGVVVATVLAASVLVSVVSVGSFCPDLDPALNHLTNALDSEETDEADEVRAVLAKFECSESVPTLADVRDDLPADAQAAFDDNADQVEAVYKCLVEAAKPVDVSGLFELVSDYLSGNSCLE